MTTIERTFTVSGIDLSGYMVKDTERAMGFYRDILGLEPARIYPESRGAEYDLPDGTTFGLWGGGGAMPFQPSNGVLFAVDDLDAVAMFIEARGLPVIARFQTPHCSMLAVHDTEGNTVFFHRRTTA